MKKTYTIAEIVENAKAAGFKYWADENYYLKTLEHMVPIFCAKYSNNSHLFRFTLDSVRMPNGKYIKVIRGVNTSGFTYIFPLEK